MPRPYRRAHTCGRDIPWGALCGFFLAAASDKRTDEEGGAEGEGGGKRVDNRSISMHRGILYAAGRRYQRARLT